VGEASLHRALIFVAMLVSAFWSVATHARMTGAEEIAKVQLTNPCFLLGAPESDPRRLIADASAFRCNLDPLSAEADTVWVRFDLSRDKISAQTRWFYDHTLFQARDEQLWVQVSDGRISKSPTTRDAARHELAGQTQRYAITAQPGQITALLIRVDGLENRRSAIPRAALISQAKLEKDAALIHLIFGVLTGILFGILFYNITLFAALRYRVLGAYCVMIAANLLYGAVWSNAILWVVPDLTTARQFDISVLSIFACFLSTAYYFETFMEKGMVPRFCRLGLRGIFMALSISTAFHFTDWAPDWRVHHQIDYTLMLSAMGLVVIGIGAAIQRGSIAVRYFLLAWTAPFVLVLAKVAWGTGVIRIEHPIIDTGVFLALSLEALLSAIGLSWRLRMLRTQRDQAQIQAHTLYKLASVDPLTEVANRRAFLEGVEAALVDSRSNGAIAIALLDLDGFKPINDAHGHAAGDAVLVEVAKRLSHRVGSRGMVGRLGGDEFAVLFTHIAGDDDCSARATGILAALSRPAIHADRTIAVSASLGYALAPRDGDTVKDLLEAADRALYAAKSAGKAQAKGHQHQQAA
jgi:diguanylate cyclase (GGDEF)-like protein